QGRKRVWSSFRGNFGKRSPHYERDGYEPQLSHLQEDDGNVMMRDIQDIPYSTRRNKRRAKWNNEGHIHITVWKDREPLKREMGKNTQDGTPGSWFKITIPCGGKYDKTWLVNSIQNYCSVPFTPVDFHYVKNQARFFVQDAGIASALKDVSYKICDEENQKISIFVNPSNVPYSVRYKLEPEEMEQLKLTMNKRYDVFQQALDLQRLRFDPGTVDSSNARAVTVALTLLHQKLLSLNLSNNKLYGLDGLSDIIQMVPTVKILNLSNNELNLVWELNKIKGLNLEELWLEGNPLCDTFPDQSTYISRAFPPPFPLLCSLFLLCLYSPLSLSPLPSYLRPLFCLHPPPPSLPPGSCLTHLPASASRAIPGGVTVLQNSGPLDGQELSPPVTVDIDTPYLIKPCKESYKGSETLKSLVLQFLQEYYLTYDSGDRQGLLSAYHHEACFSLTIPFNPKDLAPSSLCEYSKESRNIKKLKDPYLWVQLLKHTKRDIVCALGVLPKTQHDLSSFVVDMWFQTEMMLCFSVNGVFKEGVLLFVVEVEGRSQGSVRAFTRTFIVTPASNSSICIVNDELFVRDATPSETQSAFSIQVPTPISSSMSTLSQEQQEMVQSFSTQSGMKLEWSQK
ncbi:NXF2 factor, partial [Crocuta crocuta]